MRSAVAILLLASIAGPLGAEAPLLSEREALEAGKRALRERRFDDAIAAFAQCDKAYPAGVRFKASDARSEQVSFALHEVLFELEKRGAGAKDKAPYWRFYVDHYPFFSTRPTCLYFVGMEYDTVGMELAEEECREDDAKGAPDRALLCDRVKRACDAKDAEAVLSLLEKDWPAPHADHDLCAARVCPVLAAWCGGNRARRERAWPAYIACFRGSLHLGHAACVFGYPGEALGATTDPRVRRWCLQQTGPAGNEPEDEIAFDEALLACSGPWLTEATARAWAVTAFIRTWNGDDDPVEAARRLEQMNSDMPGSREVGLARFTLLWKSVWRQWDLREAWVEGYIDAWEKESPDDPYLGWARYEAVRHRAAEAGGLPLDARDRRTLERLAERYRGDALAAHTTCLLADDAAACGDGELALSRYTEAAGFDPASARLPAAEHADVAVTRARERLAAYYEQRDPSKLADLLTERPCRYEPFEEETRCGNEIAEEHRKSLRVLARRWERAGRPEEVLSVYRERLYDGMGAPRTGIDFAEICLKCGKHETLEMLAHVLEGGEPDTVGDSGKVLRQLLDDEQCLKQEGVGSAPKLLEEALGTEPRLETFFRGTSATRAHGVLAVLRSLHDTDEALASTRVFPPTAVSLLLAGAGDTEASIDYLAAVALSPTWGEEIRMLAAGALAVRGEAAARRVLTGFDSIEQEDHDWIASVLACFDPIPLCKACASLPEDFPESARRIAREQLLRIRREDPWLAYALEGK